MPWKLSIIELMHTRRRVRCTSIRIATKCQVAFRVRMRDPHDLLVVTHNSHALHAHRHMLQNVTVDHPDTGILHAQPPAAPCGVNARCWVIRVAVQIGGVAEHRALTGEHLLGGDGVVRPVAGADVVVMAAMGMERMVINAAIVFDKRARVDEDNLRYLADTSRPSVCHWVPTVVCERGV